QHLFGRGLANVDQSFQASVMGLNLVGGYHRGLLSDEAGDGPEAVARAGCSTGESDADECRAGRCSTREEGTWQTSGAQRLRKVWTRWAKDRRRPGVRDRPEGNTVAGAGAASVQRSGIS